MKPIENPPVAGADFSPDAPRSDLRNPDTWARAYVLLEELGREFPSFRLGQLICALANKARTTEPGSVYDLEDDELVAGAEEWLSWRRENR
jgi:hypothetical protein